jgi:gliding motility-associated-like protein
MNNVRKQVLNIILILGLIISPFLSLASHIVGGEITYKYQGNNRYRITVDIFQDCIGGQQNAIQQDDPAFLSLFYNDGSGQKIRSDSVGGTTINVPANFSNSCVNNPPLVCLKRIRFEFEYFLPPSPRGYIVVYQRCCRNAAIVNVVNPGNVGATYYCIIPPSTQVPVPNNSATFKNYPPQIICANVPLVYDHSATDIDAGDSLSYELCQAYIGGQPDDAKPIPEPPPFLPVAYSPPFTASNPMGGNPRIQIDPRTGLLTGTPSGDAARFVVTVCCHEWRNGVKINTVTREFQFSVTGCTKAVVANTPVFSDLPNTYIVDCIDSTVQFKNSSTGGFDWFWDFGVNGATSTEFEPTFTYPDTGTYLVKLVVNRGTTCPDSITRIVKVYPSFTGDFSISGLFCPKSRIEFADSSKTTYGTIDYWSWDFGDSQFDGNQYTAHQYDSGGIYKVILYSGSTKGCRDTTVKLVDIEKFKPFAGNDTVIVKGERIDFKASGGIYYAWTPTTLLSDPTIFNPVAYYNDEGYYRYNVHIQSEYGCQGDDSIIVRVVANPSFFVPNAFTPNGDGRNDILRPRAVGYRNAEYFRIFNRFGEMVHDSKDFEVGWDGYYKGNKADIGTYYYMLKLINRFGAVETSKGDVILLR